MSQNAAGFDVLEFLAPVNVDGGVADFVADAGVGAAAQEQFDVLGTVVEDGRVQRRVARAVGRVGVGSGAQQQLHKFQGSRGHGQVQRRVPVAVAVVDVRMGADEDLGRFRPVGADGHLRVINTLDTGDSQK